MTPHDKALALDIVRQQIQPVENPGSPHARPHMDIDKELAVLRRNIYPNGEMPDVLPYCENQIIPASQCDPALDSNNRPVYKRVVQENGENCIICDMSVHRSFIRVSIDDGQIEMKVVNTSGIPFDSDVLNQLESSMMLKRTIVEELTDDDNGIMLKLKAGTQIMQTAIDLAQQLVVTQCCIQRFFRRKEIPNTPLIDLKELSRDTSPIEQTSIRLKMEIETVLKSYQWYIHEISPDLYYINPNVNVKVNISGLSPNETVVEAKPYDTLEHVLNDKSLMLRTGRDPSYNTERTWYSSFSIETKGYVSPDRVGLPLLIFMEADPEFWSNWINNSTGDQDPLTYNSTQLGGRELFLDFNSERFEDCLVKPELSAAPPHIYAWGAPPAPMQSEYSSDEDYDPFNPYESYDMTDFY
tara:strand:+ start:119 stop:1354 length:1236 start_codon:yes stop_codon:yes gene_type:complete